MYLTTEELIALHMAIVNDAHNYIQMSQESNVIKIINFFKKLFERR